MFTALSCSRNLKLHGVVVAVVIGGFVTQTSGCKVDEEEREGDYLR